MYKKFEVSSRPSQLSFLKVRHKQAKLAYSNAIFGKFNKNLYKDA